MSIQKIYDQAEKDLSTETEQFSALLYAIVTRFNLDNKIRCISRRCIRCRCALKENLNYCERETCIDLQLSTSDIKFTKILDIGIDLTDHTGTLLNCRLIDQFAEKILGYTVEEFEGLTENEIVNIKLKFFLQRCELKILFKKKTVIRTNHFISILDMKLASLEDVANKIKVY